MSCKWNIYLEMHWQLDRRIIANIQYLGKDHVRVYRHLKVYPLIDGKCANNLERIQNWTLAGLLWKHCRNIYS